MNNKDSPNIWEIPKELEAPSLESRNKGWLNSVYQHTIENLPAILISFG